MCWVGNIHHKRIAEKDIHCKKIIAKDSNGCLDAWYRKGHPYAVGETYEEKLDIELRSKDSDLIDINKGLHCYNYKCTITMDITITHKLPYFVVAKTVGLFRKDFYHTHQEELTAECNAYVNPVIVEVVIPKGTTYYENYFGEIVTEKFVITKFIDPDHIRK